MSADLGAPAPFFPLLSGARKLLVLDLGFLGDLVHLIPALWCIRRALPQAELHVCGARHACGLFELTPWVQRVWDYPRFPRSEPWYRDLKRVLALRRARFDAVINLNGSQRSSLLTGLSGAPLRLGRLQPRRPLAWQRLFTHAYHEEFGTRPLYEQRLRVLEQAGFPRAASGPELVLPAAATAWLRREGLEGHGVIHVSPCASEDSKELPLETLASVLDLLASRQPPMPLVLTCSSSARERERLQRLISRLARPPLRVYAGGLSLAELAALLRASRLHLGADSGVLHLAALLGIPTLSWFRRYPGAVEWLPQGPEHTHVEGEASPRGLAGLDPAELEKKFLAALARGSVHLKTATEG